jgi:hypothetical protein
MGYSTYSTESSKDSVLGVVYSRVKNAFDILNHYMHLHGDGGGKSFDDTILLEYLRLSQQSSHASVLALTFTDPEILPTSRYSLKHEQVANVFNKLPPEIVQLDFLVDTLERLSLNVRRSEMNIHVHWSYSWCFQILYECGASLQELYRVYIIIWSNAVQKRRTSMELSYSDDDFWSNDEGFHHLRKVLLILLDELLRREGSTSMNTDMKRRIQLFVNDATIASRLSDNDLENSAMNERLQRIKKWVDG